MPIVHATPRPDAVEPVVAGPPAPVAAVSRRSALKGLGLGAVTVVVAGTGVASYRVFDNGVLDAGAGTPYRAWSHWLDEPGPLGTVAAAILAANPHNSQPWRFRVTSASVDVHTDPSRRTGTLDPLGREQQTGLGCALENLVLAAQARGFAPTVTLLPPGSDPTLVATVALGAGAPEDSPLYRAIPRRRSNRGPYTAADVAPEVLSRLDAQTAGLDGVTVRWFTTPTERAAMGELLIAATRAVIADTEQSQDSFAWFRNDRDAIEAHPDGLTLDGQGLSPLVLALGKILPATSRTAGDAFWLTQTRTVHTRTAAAYGVILVADPDDPAQRLRGGRLLQRVHLAATVEGLALQHMNQVTERIDRESSTGAAPTFAPTLDALLGQPGRRALTTFRIGHPVRAARLSPRRPLKEVTS